MQPIREPQWSLRPYFHAFSPWMFVGPSDSTSNQQHTAKAVQCYLRLPYRKGCGFCLRHVLSHSFTYLLWEKLSAILWTALLSDLQVKELSLGNSYKLGLANSSVSNPGNRLTPTRSQDDWTLASTLTTALWWMRIESETAKLYGFSTYRNILIVNVCCIKPLSLGITC